MCMIIATQHSRSSMNGSIHQHPNQPIISFNFPMTQQTENKNAINSIIIGWFGSKCWSTKQQWQDAHGMADRIEDRRGEAGAHLNCGDEEEATTATVVARWTHQDHMVAKPEVVRAKGLQPRERRRWPRQAQQSHHPDFEDPPAIQIK
jgi:hypothetical protein